MSKRLLRCYYTALPEKNNRIAGTCREKHFFFIQADNGSEGIHKLAFCDYIFQMYHRIFFSISLERTFRRKCREKSFFITPSNY